MSSSFIREKYYVPLRAIERGLTYGIRTGDVDGDGVDELLLLGERYAHVMKVYDLEQKHVEMREYIPDPANIELYVPKSGTIADIDGDGQKEVVLAITLGTGLSYRISFKSMWMSKKVAIDFKINGMAYGDLDKDGIPEFILYGDSEGADHNLIVIKGGEIIAKHLVGLEILAAGLGDINGDGKKELVLSTVSSTEGGTKKYYLEAYEISDTSLNELFKVPTSREVIKISIEDIDRDGVSEIYVMSHAKVSALRYNGRYVEKLRDTPELIEQELRDFLTDDFDSDGYVETLVAVSKGLILYEHGIPELNIEEEVKNRGFTCLAKGNLKDGKYVIAGLDDGIRFGKL